MTTVKSVAAVAQSAAGMLRPVSLPMDVSWLRRRRAANDRQMDLGDTTSADFVKLLAEADTTMKAVGVNAGTFDAQQLLLQHSGS